MKKQRGLYQSKVNSILVCIQRPGSWAHNCKMAYLDATIEHRFRNVSFSFLIFPCSFVVLFSIVLRQLCHLHQERTGVCYKQTRLWWARGTLIRAVKIHWIFCFSFCFEGINLDIQTRVLMEGNLANEVGLVVLDTIELFCGHFKVSALHFYFSAAVFLLLTPVIFRHFWYYRYHWSCMLKRNHISCVPGSMLNYLQ